MLHDDLKNMQEDLKELKAWKNATAEEDGGLYGGASCPGVVVDGEAVCSTRVGSTKCRISLVHSVHWLVIFCRRGVHVADKCVSILRQVATVEITIRIRSVWMTMTELSAIRTAKTA